VGTSLNSTFTSISTQLNSATGSGGGAAS